MRLRRRVLVPVLLALPFTVLAAWPTNSTEDLIVARMSAPTIDGLLADKDGGVAVLFEDTVTSQGIDLFVEQVTADGTRVLNTATDGGFRGKSLYGAVNDQRGQQLVTDGAGGFYALWIEGFTQLRVARFGGDGTQVGSFSTFMATAGQGQLQPDGTGGVYVAYDRNLIHLDSAGAPLAGPVSISSSPDNRASAITPVDALGTVASNSNYLIPLINSFTPSLTSRWTVQGAPSALLASGARFITVTDTKGGAWVVFNSAQHGDDVYVQHIYLDGGYQFFDAGLQDPQPIAVFTGVQTQVAASADGTGGLYVVYTDTRSGQTLLYLQHVNAAGQPDWNVGNGGELLTTQPVTTRVGALALVGANDVMVAWGAENPAIVRAQRYASDGGRQWPFGGAIVSTPPQNYTYLRNLEGVRLSDGNAIVGMGYYDGTGSNKPEVHLKRIPVDGLFYDAGMGPGGGAGGSGGSSGGGAGGGGGSAGGGSAGGGSAGGGSAGGGSAGGGSAGGGSAGGGSAGGGAAGGGAAGGSATGGGSGTSSVGGGGGMMSGGGGCGCQTGAEAWLPLALAALGRMVTRRRPAR